MIDWEKYIEYVEEKAIERAKTVGWKYEKNKIGDEYQSEREIDFFMGASAVFFMLKAQDKLPSSWLLCPMGNRSIISLEKLRENDLIPRV